MRSPARVSLSPPRGFLCLIAVGLLMSGCSSSSTSPPPPDPAPMIAEGWVLYEGGDFVGAGARFEAALRIDAALAEGHSGLGYSLARRESYDEAVVSFEQALELAPANADALAGMVMVEAARNSHAEVIDPATHLLVLVPDYVHPHDAQVDARVVRLLRAQAYYRMGEWRRAAADLDLLFPAAAPHSTDPELLLAALAAAGGFGP